jgi:hypothetical protein
MFVLALISSEPCGQLIRNAAHLQNTNDVAAKLNVPLDV